MPHSFVMDDKISLKLEQITYTYPYRQTWSLSSMFPKLYWKHIREEDYILFGPVVYFKLPFLITFTC